MANVRIDRYISRKYSGNFGNISIKDSFKKVNNNHKLEMTNYDSTTHCDLNVARK